MNSRLNFNTNVVRPSPQMQQDTFVWEYLEMKWPSPSGYFLLFLPHFCLDCIIRHLIFKWTRSSPGSFVNYSVTHICWISCNSVTKNSMLSMPHPWEISQIPTYATVLMLRWHFASVWKITLGDILWCTIKEGLFFEESRQNIVGLFNELP